MISVVIPLFNEEKNLRLLYEELLKSGKDLKEKLEIIFVDDGSTDNSLEILKDLSRRDKSIKIFSFRKNMGKAEALDFGFNKVLSKYVITMDADLQDKPSEAPKLIEKLDEGYDLVCGWRKDRKDSFKKILSSKFFNFIASVLWGLKLHDYNCGLKAYKSNIVKDIKLYGGLHRFIPLLVFQQGYKICEVPVEHDYRMFGKSKYGFSKLWKDFPDILSIFFLSRFSNRPFHLFGIVGGTTIVFGFFILLYLTVIWLQGHSIGRRPLLFLGMLLVLGGLQILFTGFLADLITHMSRRIEDGEEKSNIPLKYSSDAEE